MKKYEMTFNDKEIKGIGDFAFSNHKPERGIIEFHGIFMPQNDEIADKINNSAPFRANVYLPNNEVMKDVLVRATIKDGEITIEPVEEEAQARIKEAWFGVAPLKVVK